MKFTKLVRNKNIPWPTQRKFSLERWKSDGSNFIEDATDSNIYHAGIWANKSLTHIRSQIADMQLWHLSVKTMARNLLAFVNSDTTLMHKKHIEVVSDSQLRPIGAYDELAYEKITDNLWGSKKASSILDTAIDSLDLCLRFASGVKPKNSNATSNESEYPKALNLAALYNSIENVFYDVVWLNWTLREEKGFWILEPQDYDREALLAASLKRHEDLLAQTITSAGELWIKNRPLIKRFEGDFSKSIFQITEDTNNISVFFVRNEESDVPPQTFLYQSATTQLHYSPLLNTELDSLAKLRIIDLLNVFIELREIAKLIFEKVVSASSAKNFKELVDTHCPLIKRASVVRAISQSLRIEEQKVSRLIDLLTWKEDKSSVYFRPVFSMDTSSGLCVFFAFHPILAFNPYWVVDQWISEFGLGLDWRGSLFEEQIYREVSFAAHHCQFKELVKVSCGQKLSADDSTSEELDVIIKINDHVIVGEAKCQKFPISPIEYTNYLDTLDTATKQATRKAAWAYKHLDVIARNLGVKIDEIKRISPLVVINHSIGVGLVINGVPILDLLLLENYFARPYSSTGIAEGFEMTEIRGKAFYTNPTEFSENFSNYALYPHPIHKILSFFKPEMIFLPLGIDKPLGKIEFIVDTDKIPNVPLNK